MADSEEDSSPGSPSDYDSMPGPRVVTITKSETGFGFNVRGQVSGNRISVLLSFLVLVYRGGSRMQNMAASVKIEGLSCIMLRLRMNEHCIYTVSIILNCVSLTNFAIYLV